MPSTPHVFFNDNVKTGDNGPGTLTVAFGAPVNGSVAEGTTDGTFIYMPNVGFAGPTDTFTYTLTDGNGVTNTGTVTINLSGLVWYVNGSGGNGDGRSHLPFNSVTNAQAPSGDGQIIYVHTGGATTPGTITLKPMQTLWGAGQTLLLNALTIPFTGSPLLTGTVTLASSVLVNSLNINGSGGPAISGTNVGGTVALNSVNVVGGTSGINLTNLTGSLNFQFTSVSGVTPGASLLLSGGTANVTGRLGITSTVGRSVDIQGKTAGTVTLGGGINDTGSGIFLNNNAGATIDFTGGLALNTGANPAFTATGGGTISVTQNNTTVVNTIATTTGTALNVANTTIGASGLTFRSISASGPTKGIILNTTGSGQFIVTGSGSADGSGGTIQAASGNGAEFISANTISLSNMNFTGNGTSQVVAGSASTCGGNLLTGNNLSCVSNIHLQTVGTVTLNNLNVTNSGQMGINGNGVSAFAISNSTVTNNGNETFENGLTFQNLTGTSSITDSIIRDNFSHQVNVTNIASNSTLTLGITGTRTNNAYPTQDTSTTMIGRTSVPAASEAGILFNTLNTSTNVNMTLNLTGVVMNNNYPANAILLNPNSASGSLGGTTTDSAFDRNGGGIIIQAQNGMGGTYNVTNSEFNQTDLQSILYAGLNPFTGTLQGTVQGNTIGTTASAGSACSPGGSNCTGIDVNMIGGSGSIQLRLQSNVVQQFDGNGIRVAANGSGSVHATIQSNTIQNPFNLVARGIDTNIGITAGAAVVGCFNITGNTVTGTYEDPGAGTQFGIHTRVRFLSEHRLPGMSGTGAANAVIFLSTNNPSAVGKIFAEGGGVPGYQSGAACTTP